jgi:predicted transcriptional regulator
MAHGTVVTLLRRLEDRRLVKRRKADQGKAFVYSPTKGHARTFGPLASSLMQRAFGGKPAALVASLFETRPPSTEEIDELEALVERLRDERRK